MNVLRAIRNAFSRRQNTRITYASVREEFDEHLEAINENTTEIAQNHAYLCGMEKKMEKLAERLDHQQLFLSQLGYGNSAQQFTIQPLNAEEKKVFLAVYTIEDGKGHVTYADISKALVMDLQLVSGYVASLMEKGVPIVKRYVNNIAYLRLDQNFKQLQAKENVLGIDKSQKQLVQF